MAEEIQLDPKDWDELRELGHQMLDDIFRYLQTVREKPAWVEIPNEVKAHFREPVPRAPQDPKAIYEEFLAKILPYPLGNTHPRFWGWVTGTGTPLGMLAEMLAAGMNSNVGGAEHIATYVELQVIDWFKEVFGFPRDSSGILVSGASIANLLGLIVARNVAIGNSVRDTGIQNVEKQLTAYCSVETHSSVQRAMEVMGLGNRALRQIPITADKRIDVNTLEAVILEDKAKGYQPFALIGNAGTTNTGAFDSFSDLADLAERYGLWLHVDGAFGALVNLAPSLRHLTYGIERAHSLAFDMHKWLHIPHEAGCILFKDKYAHHSSFAMQSDYLFHHTKGTSSADIWLGDYGIQLSRSFRALKVWMSIKEHGIERFGDSIKRNVDQANYLKQLIDSAPQLQLLAPVSLNIVCFRYYDASVTDTKLNDLNQMILIELQRSGIAVPSSTIVDGNYAIRVAITNHRSQYTDFDLFIDKVLQVGQDLLQKFA